jgi:hypothetical protein
MATLDRTANDRTWAALRSAVDSAFDDAPRYPEGTVFVPADTPDLADVLDQHRERESRAPVVVVYEDGREEFVVGSPEVHRFALGVLVGVAAAFVIDKLGRARL